MRIKLSWNKYLERWIVKTHLEEFNIFELPDCVIFNMVFMNADKNKINTYEIEAKKIENLKAFAPANKGDNK